jgi:hypothetical protein
MEARTQRRAILRASIKSAYATPLIALSMRAATKPVGAISEQQCGDACYFFDDAQGCCVLRTGCVPTTIPQRVCPE